MKRIMLILSSGVVLVVMLWAMTVPALATVYTDANGYQCEYEDGMADDAAGGEDGAPDGLPPC